MLKLITASAFHFTSGALASFRIDFDTPPETAALGHEIPTLVSQCRAAGVSAVVYMPVDLGGRGAFFGSSYAPALNAARGFSSSYNAAVSGLYGHAERA